MSRCIRPIGFLISITILAAPSLLAAQTTAAFPLLVIRDDDEHVVAPVISVDQGIPIALYDDTSPGGRKVHLRFLGAFGFTTEEILIFYSGLNCTEDAFLTPPAERTGLRNLTGIGYGIGPGMGGDFFLYRTTAATGVNKNYQSTYNPGSAPDFTNPSQGCSNVAGSDTLVETTDILNINTQMPPPYTVD